MYCVFNVKTANRKALIAVLILLAIAVLVSLLIPKTHAETADTIAVKTGNTLVIDPGHGGIDGGAVAVDGSKESDINLAIALKLRALAEFYGLENTMTRQDDSTMSTTENYSEHNDLVNRTEIVNTTSNPVLISIHQNCYPTGQPSGPQVLYSSSNESEIFGKLTQKNLITVLYPDNRRVAEPATNKLYMLSHVTCPAILVECGFVSNLSDMTKLNDANYQTTLSTVLMASYLQYNSGLINT
jgi:N-acetylmuramoyl-L-alanine amidase